MKTKINCRPIYMKIALTMLVLISLSYFLKCLKNVSLSDNHDKLKRYNEKMKNDSQLLKFFF